MQVSGIAFVRFAFCCRSNRFDFWPPPAKPDVSGLQIVVAGNPSFSTLGGMGSVPSHSLPLPNGTGWHGGYPSPTGLQTLQETRSEAKVFSHNDIWILRL